MDGYPLVFEPIFKPKIWGGRALETLLGKRLPAGEPIGESWEIADLEDDQTVVAEALSVDENELILFSAKSRQGKEAVWEAIQRLL